MEEKFLRTRAERTEARQQRGSDSAGSALERQQFEDQSKAFEQDIVQCLGDGDGASAQERLNAFKIVVQEATSSNVLTAYDMAKSNSTLSRLQALIDAKRSDPQASKSFKFSFTPKSRNPCTAAEAVATSQRAAESDGDTTRSTGSTITTRGKTLFITPSKAVFLRACEDCVIMIPPVAGSVFVSDCSKCKIYVACHQLRLKCCTELDVYVSCASTPIIECCSGMRFGPYSCWTGILKSRIAGQQYATHEEWIRRLGEIDDPQRAEEAYETVDDFQWIKKTPSPNWCVLTPQQWEVNAQPFVEEDTAQ
uniref:Uncharacterized protein TCIL3000_11_9950 n=1 Tax=Trypanosoma congolense (strain IL3000) TaxID=1068625 RepID=G0V1K2_TRYCI|nr:unnamed protein product [Trypanosoma congolense IL3000]